MRQFFTILLLLVFVSAFSQDEKNISGKIVVKDATPMGVHVINVDNEKEVISDKDGNFTIPAKEDDVLVFSATHLDLMRYMIEKRDLDSGKIAVTMTSKVTQLDEVVVDNSINALSLGIISAPIKSKTPAERRLYASESSSIDDLINILSGRKKMLLDDIKTERKNNMLEKLDGYFDESFYTNTLCIEKDQIPGFYYYLVEDEAFTTALNSGNKQRTELAIIGLAEQYKSRQNAH